LLTLKDIGCGWGQHYADFLKDSWWFIIKTSTLLQHVFFYYMLSSVFPPMSDQIGPNRTGHSISVLFWKDYFYPASTLREQVDVIFKDTAGFVTKKAACVLLCGCYKRRIETAEMKFITRVPGLPLQDKSRSHSI
jgi:hypothetical protein